VRGEEQRSRWWNRQPIGPAIVAAPRVLPEKSETRFVAAKIRHSATRHNYRPFRTSRSWWKLCFVRLKNRLLDEFDSRQSAEAQGERSAGDSPAAK
jgi:hypothetical protein